MEMIYCGVIGSLTFEAYHCVAYQTFPTHLTVLNASSLPLSIRSLGIVITADLDALIFTS